MRVLRRSQVMKRLKTLLHKFGRTIRAYSQAIQTKWTPVPQPSRASGEAEQYVRARFPRVHVRFVSEAGNNKDA